MCPYWYMRGWPLCAVYTGFIATPCLHALQDLCNTMSSRSFCVYTVSMLFHFIKGKNTHTIINNHSGLNTWFQWIVERQLQDEARKLSFGITCRCALYKLFHVASWWPYWTHHILFAHALRAWAIWNDKGSFCLFIVVSQLLWQRVDWELPGYFRLIFHICTTKLNNSVTHEISVTVRFILCETTMACFLLGRLFNSLTTGVVLVVSSDMLGSVSPRNSNPSNGKVRCHSPHSPRRAEWYVCCWAAGLLTRNLASWPNYGVDILCRSVVIK